MDIDQFVPFDSKIHENHQVPQCAGGLIAYWDDPEMVPAAAANHMRDDDYVIGAVYKGKARAWPIWIVDYYHIINDILADEPVMLVSCERCQSGSLFIARIDSDRRAKFFASGFYNATLMISERRGFIGEPPSLWVHYSGVAITGKYKGIQLEQIPTFHFTWKDWKQLHPDTEVMLEPVNPDHPDARQGHGRDEYFSRPGMEIGASQTIYGSLDRQYPENQMVLGVYVENSTRAYPLREIKKAGGFIEDTIGGKKIVVFSGPKASQFAMAAYVCSIDGKELSFEFDGDFFIDKQTKSRWSIEGQAVEGECSGKSLQPVNNYYLRWHAWVYVHKNRDIYIHKDPVAQYPALPCPGIDIKIFKPLLDAIANVSKTLTIEMAIPDPALPVQAEQGLIVRLDNEPLNLYLFTESQAANDYIYFEGAWHYNLIIPRLGRKKAIKINRFIIESDPDVQYEDSTQVSRLPDNQIKWSPLVTDPDLVNQLHNHFPDDDPVTSAYFRDLITLLKKRRFDVIDVGFLPQCQLYVGVINGISATIEGYRYSIYRCVDNSVAASLNTRFTCSLQVAELVFASLPEKMHIYIRHEAGLDPAEKINWPTLLENEKFLKTIKKYTG